ncbi:hypothetical protein OESDEN_10263 [Oesophagostomum dentatum]|uniref:Uncharacterized protein n=1 Tax=Oesophagostomum dentatum TaxID=61180 RepID=A0A0B1T276_OESDE|nr:hypothetical protein OESDEN_10263 [Oesophagostomum dentatum]
MTVINYLSAQSFSSKELENICEVLRRAKIFGPRCLAPFYELCLNMEQVSLIRSVIESSEALSEQSLAIFLDYVAELASKEKSREDAEQLLSMLLRRHFGARRLAECAAQKITTQHASVLLQRCTELYVLPKYSEIAEQVLSLMTVLTDTFGNRLIWENDLHDVVKDTLEFSERMAEIVSCFKHIELKRSQTAREDEDDLSTLYTVETISLPRRPLNW